MVLPCLLFFSSSQCWHLRFLFLKRYITDQIHCTDTLCIWPKLNVHFPDRLMLLSLKLDLGENLTPQTL